MILEKNRFERCEVRKLKKKRKRNSMRKQKEDKAIPSGLTSISVVEGGGSKKEDNVERELKLESPREMKVKLSCEWKRRTPWGNARSPTSRHNRRGYCKI